MSFIIRILDTINFYNTLIVRWLACVSIEFFCEVPIKLDMNNDSNFILMKKTLTFMQFYTIATYNYAQKET